MGSGKNQNLNNTIVRIVKSRDFGGVRMGVSPKKKPSAALSPASAKKPKPAATVVENNGKRSTRAAGVKSSAVAIDLPWVKKLPAEVQTDLYGTHAHSSPSSPGVILPNNVPVEKISSPKQSPPVRSAAPPPPPPVEQPKPEEPKAEQRRRDTSRAKTPSRASPPVLAAPFSSKTPLPSSKEQPTSVVFAARSVLRAVQDAYEKPSSPVRELPSQDDPLADHLRYHAEVHWGLNKETVTACALAVAAVVAVWLSALLTKATSAALGVAIHVPVPTLNLRGLWAAVTHPQFGIPALLRSLAARGQAPSAVNAGIGTLAVFLLAMVLQHGSPSVMMPLYRTLLRWRSGLSSDTKSVGGWPTVYLEGVPKGGRAVRVAHKGYPTVLVIHDAFGSKQDVHSLVTAGFEGFHVVVPDLPGHGDHLASKGPFAQSPEELAHWLTRFRFDVLGSTRVHHVVGIGYGACVAMAYAQLPVVKDYVASVSLLAPYGLEPMSENFKHTIGNSTLLSQKMAQPYTAKQHHLKCCAQPAFKPAFWFKHQVKEWTRLERSLVATARALHAAHEAGALFRQIEQEDSGLPMLVVFGEHDILAKDGALVEVPRLLSLNEHLEDLVVPRAGHNVLYEHHAALSVVAQRLKAFVREKHRLFLDASSAHMS